MALQYEFAEGNYYLPTCADLGDGVRQLQTNVFLIKGSKKSLLVDTGLPANAGQTVRTLAELINLAELDYIFLTHADIDHVGGVAELLKIAPKVRLVGSPTNMGKGVQYGFPITKFAMVFPGEEIDLGDRTVRIEPSLIEDGHTNWLLDTKTGTYFTSDAFGVLHFKEPVYFAENLPDELLGKGFAMWQQMTFNLLPLLDRQRFVGSIRDLERREIGQIASAHGPLIRTDLNNLYDLMASMPFAEMPPAPVLPPMFRL